MNVAGIMPEGELGLSGFRCSGKTPGADLMRIGFFQECCGGVKCAAGSHDIINDKDVFAGQVETGLYAHIGLTAGSLSGGASTLLLMFGFLQKRMKGKAQVIRDGSGQFFTQIKTAPESPAVAGGDAGDDFWVIVGLVVKGRACHQHERLYPADLPGITFVLAAMQPVRKRVFVTERAIAVVVSWWRSLAATAQPLRQHTLAALRAGESHVRQAVQTLLADSCVAAIGFKAEFTFEELIKKRTEVTPKFHQG